MSGHAAGAPARLPPALRLPALRLMDAGAARVVPAALGVAGLALALALPRPGSWIAALAVVVALGVPHGALDSEIARPLLRPLFGRAWFAVFAVPYLALAALVLLAWRLAPEATLAAFLAASVLHFGEEDAGPGDGLALLVRGGLPVAVPVLARPEETARFLSVVAGAPLGVPVWLHAAALALVPLALAWLARDLRRGEGRAVAEVAALVAAFVLLPPLVAFAGYFVLLHAPRHVAALVASDLAPRVRDGAGAWHRALPATGLTLLLGGALWPLTAGPTDERLLCLVIQGLAALTLPHMLLGAVAARRAARAAGPRRL